MSFYSEDSVIEARALFDKISQIFEKDNINPTPINYLVWYAYLKGDRPKLVGEMDEILADPFGYHDRLGRELYEKYLASGSEAEQGIDLAFRRLLNAMARKLSRWAEKLDANAQDLAECRSSLSHPDLSPEKIHEITQVVMDTAQSMKQESLNLHTEVLDQVEEIQRLREELKLARSAVLVDELTEVGNRRAFNEALLELTDRAVEDESASVCLIMTDIDHFKHFNDEFGHLVGDSVLRFFTSKMKSLSHENETVCRYGGEEFAILLTDVTLEEAKARAEIFRRALESARLKRKGSDQEIGRVTASFGVACYKKEIPETPEDFVERADQALYQAKETGRNKVVTELELAS